LGYTKYGFKKINKTIKIEKETQDENRSDGSVSAPSAAEYVVCDRRGMSGIFETVLVRLESEGISGWVGSRSGKSANADR